MLTVLIFLSILIIQSIILYVPTAVFGIDGGIVCTCLLFFVYVWASKTKWDFIAGILITSCAFMLSCMAWSLTVRAML